MKLSKILSIISFVTCLSLLYVYQQTEIIRLAYIGQKQRVLFDDLLDKNRILRYNIKRDASLVHIASRVSDGTDFQMPETYQLVRLAPSEEGLKAKGNLRAQGRETALSRIFGIKRQAEAKTVNP
jgi:hypothetical protein